MQRENVVVGSLWVTEVGHACCFQKAMEREQCLRRTIAAGTVRQFTVQTLGVWEKAVRPDRYTVGNTRAHRMPTGSLTPTFVPVLDGPAALPADELRPSVEARVPRLLPTAEMRAAKGRLEPVLDPPLRDEECLSMNGWLAPDGALYSCGYKSHDQLCRVLGFAHESAIEQAGFCKLTNLEWLVSARYCPRSLTDAQWATIERWYMRNGFAETHFLRLTARL